MDAVPTDIHIPLFVDLDGTLIRTDVAQELLVKSIGTPSQIVATVTAAMSGRASLKHYLASANAFDATTLPYNQQVMDYLIAEKAKGRKVILATAADIRVATKIADHLGLFDQVIASDQHRNLKGTEKLAAIRAISKGPFEYLGDARADLPIWQEAAVVGFVNPANATRAAVDKNSHVSLDIMDNPPLARSVLKAMRPHQWTKNCLIFLPLFFSHGYTDSASVLNAVIAFGIFCLFASSIYIINDLLDIEADRQHAKKRHRPFASGRMLPIQGVIASIGLAALAFIASLSLLSVAMSLIFLLYIVITTLYSMWLKHYSTIDVITLTCLYTLRIVAGGVAISVTLSPWLLNFSLFFFLSLALMKRYIELVRIQKTGKEKSRGYYISDMQAVLPMGIANGGLAVLTLTLYLNSDYVAQTYASPTLLWLIAPLTLFWVYRAWIWALRDKIDDDPVVFALRDKISRLTLFITCTLVISAKFISLEAWFQ